jgi:hypothetical protein
MSWVTQYTTLGLSNVQNTLLKPEVKQVLVKNVCRDNWSSPENAVWTVRGLIHKISRPKNSFVFTKRNVALVKATDRYCRMLVMLECFTGDTFILLISAQHLNAVFAASGDNQFVGKVITVIDPEPEKDWDGNLILTTQNMLVPCHVEEREMRSLFPLKEIPVSFGQLKDVFCSYSLLVDELKISTANLEQSCGNRVCDGSHGKIKACISNTAESVLPKYALQAKVKIPVGNGQAVCEADVRSISLAQFYVEDAIICSQRMQVSVIPFRFHIGEVNLDAKLNGNSMRIYGWFRISRDGSGFSTTRKFHISKISPLFELDSTKMTIDMCQLLPLPNYHSYLSSIPPKSLPFTLLPPQSPFAASPSGHSVGTTSIVADYESDVSVNGTGFVQDVESSYSDDSNTAKLKKRTKRRRKRSSSGEVSTPEPNCEMMGHSDADNSCVELVDSDHSEASSECVTRHSRCRVTSETSINTENAIDIISRESGVDDVQEERDEEEQETGFVDASNFMVPTMEPDEEDDEDYLSRSIVRMPMVQDGVNQAFVICAVDGIRRWTKEGYEWINLNGKVVCKHIEEGGSDIEIVEDEDDGASTSNHITNPLDGTAMLFPISPLDSTPSFERAQSPSKRGVSSVLTRGRGRGGRRGRMEVPASQRKITGMLDGNWYSMNLINL